MTGPSPGAAKRHRRSTRRLRIACARCRQRKIRCDAATPACTTCARAGAFCAYEGDLPIARRQQLSDSRAPMTERDMHADATNSSTYQQHAQPSLAQQLPSPGFWPSDGVGTGQSAPSRLADVVARDHNSSTDEARDGHCESASQPLPAQPSGRSDGLRATLPESHLSHQIGLVSLSVGNDPKYIGSSSGYFFAQLLQTRGACRDGGPIDDPANLQDDRQRVQDRLAVQAFKDIPTSLPATESLAKNLSGTFFESIHLQYPFLHKPSHERHIREVYQFPGRDKSATFQVTMVLSISALILSRRSHVELPAAGWCAAAMKEFSSLPFESSLRRLQCLLLLLVYGMHSPSSEFNVWSINYQCIAMVIDLGLQREPSNQASLSLLQRQMRTRTFWAVYSLDRKLSTMMGRPIGLRDEACDLRFPANIDDEHLEGDFTTENASDQPSHIDFSIQFFKLAQINSEMKYVLHSVNRETPSYAYPNIRNIFEWQEVLKKRLDEWYDAIPQRVPCDLYYGEAICKTQYHLINMLLFLPSPAIPQPRTESLRNCYESSISAIKLFRSLYARNMLIYNWNTCHAIILHGFCFIYCINVIPQLRAETTMESIMANIRAVSDTLSATGEYWTSARRARDLLNDLASNTLLRDVGNLKVNSLATSATSSNAADAVSASAHARNDVATPLSAQRTSQRDEGIIDANNLDQGYQQECQDLQPLSMFFEGLSNSANGWGNDFDIDSLFVEVMNNYGISSDNSGTGYHF